MNASYDPLLVVLSVALAAFASYTALDLANSLALSHARARVRAAWLVGGSLAMGTGIWSMHFVGMLALRMPGVSIAYDVPLLLLSVAVAVAASGLALWVIGRRSAGTRLRLLAALAMGAAIAGMHYIGMWSMHLAARIEWHAGLVALSIAIAVGASFAAFWLAFHTRARAGGAGHRARLAGGLVMGTAIAGMHYTAMAAARFHPLPRPLAVDAADVLATSGLAVAVSGTSLLILGIAVSGSVLGRELGRRSALAAENERLYRQAEASAAEAERARRAAEAAADRLRAVQSITDAALSNLDTDSLLQALLARVADALHCDYATLLLLDGDALRVRAALGLDEQTRLALRIPLGVGISGRIAASGRPEVLDDVAADPDVSEALRARVHSLAGVPLAVGERVIGVLHVGSREPRAFRDEDVQLLAVVAGRSATAVERAHLLDETLLASRAKSEFLANMSHELRTPINAVMGYTELMEMGIGGPLTEQQRHYLAKVRASNQHLLTLINEILDLAKIEAGRMSVERHEQAVWGVVGDAVGVAEPLATQKGIEIGSHCARDADVAFIGDPHRVRQILINLLSNAVKFTGEGGRIRVSCGRTATPDEGARLEGAEAWTFIHVEDTGVGIAEDQQARVWEPFAQVDGGLSRAHGGTGLGLTISRRFARLMGGDLTLRSSPGRGSRFTLWLPAGTEAGVAERAAAGAAGFSDVGGALLDRIDEVLAAVARRLRAEPLLPDAGRVTDAELEDHQATLLADVAQALVILQETGASPELLRDGSHIRRVVSERHGVQRARLGWPEALIVREFEILGQELEAALREAGRARPSDETDRALALILELVDEARRLSLRGYRMAGSSAGAA